METPESKEEAVRRRIRAAGERAKAEAEARRKAAPQPDRPKEHDGRGGLEPTRYGDWEIKGTASDF